MTASSSPVMSHQQERPDSVCTEGGPDDRALDTGMLYRPVEPDREYQRRQDAGSRHRDVVARPGALALAGQTMGQHLIQQLFVDVYERTDRTSTAVGFELRLPAIPRIVIRAKAMMLKVGHVRCSRYRFCDNDANDTISMVGVAPIYASGARLRCAVQHKRGFFSRPCIRWTALSRRSVERGPSVREKENQFNVFSPIMNCWRQRFA